jgi:GWxTD domain-containing protein
LGLAYNTVMKKIILLLLAFGPILFACAAARLPKNMEAKHKQFLSEARYTISGQERRIFSNLPPSERDAFIEEFWKKRDPDPATEANEFKEEYYKRIEEANRLFTERDGNGWLEDRGRIYILLGPPWERYTYPRGQTFYGKPTEIWYYGFFPIAFIDNDWNGTYDLDPLSAQQVAMINKAQMDLKPQVQPEKTLFDFRVGVEKVKGGEVLVRIRIPYRNLWFAAEKGGLRTGLELNLTVFNKSEAVVWDFKETYAVETTEDKLKEVIKDDYVIEVPARLGGGPGSYRLKTELKNRTDEARVEKNLDFEI